MAIQIACAFCSAALKVKDELIGKGIKCPKCGQRLPVDAQGGGATVTVTPEAGGLANVAGDKTGQIPAATPGADATCDFPSSAAGVCEEVAPAAAPAATEFLSTPDAESSGTQALPSTADATATQTTSGAADAGMVRSLGGYSIVRELGQGGTGAVYEAEDDKLRRRVALKVMKPEIANNPRHRERFLREARTAAKVKCDFICPIYAVGEDNGIPFIAMQLLKGEPLDAPVKQGVRLPVGDVLRASGSPSGGNGRTRSPTGPSSSVSTRIRSMV